MKNEEAWQPANPKIIAIFLAVALIAVFGFTVVLSATLQVAVPFALQGEEKPLPEPLCVDFMVTREGKKIVVEGYAHLQTTYVASANSDVVLYHEDTQTYLQLPTEMLSIEKTIIDWGVAKEFRSAGLYATVYEAQLDTPIEGYEICVAYQNNLCNTLVHTGYYLEVAQ